MGEYVAIELKIEDELLIIEEKRRIIFMHSRCSEIRGSSGKIHIESLTLFIEKVKIGTDFKHFLAWAYKYSRNIFIIYKFLN